MRKTLQQQITANRRASAVYAWLLVLLLGLVGGAIVGLYEPNYWFLGALGAAGLGGILAGISLTKGADIVLNISNARQASPLELQRLNNVTEEMAIAAGIPKPQVYVIDDTALNAFATGRDPASGVVVITHGLLEKLDRDELQGVIAHEVAHIRNYDIRLMTTLALVAGLIPLLADYLGRAIFWGGSRRNSDKDNHGFWVILGIILAVLAPLFAMLLKMAVSRQREFLADTTAAELTRNPEGLAQALEKITHSSEPLEAANRATQHMYICNPLKLEGDGGNLFSTHPPIEQRLRNLRNLAGALPTQRLP